MEHSQVPNECYQEQIQELAEICDNEYYLSALPSTNKERVERGRKRITQAIKDMRELQQNVLCLACQDEITRQISIQEEGLKEIPKG